MTGAPGTPWLWALPFLLTFIGGVFADAYEGPRGRLALGAGGAIVLLQAVLCLLSLPGLVAIRDNLTNSLARHPTPKNAANRGENRPAQHRNQPQNPASTCAVPASRRLLKSPHKFKQNKALFPLFRLAKTPSEPLK